MCKDNNEEINPKIATLDEVKLTRKEDKVIKPVRPKGEEEDE